MIDGPREHENAADVIFYGCRRTADWQLFLTVFAMKAALETNIYQAAPFCFCSVCFGCQVTLNINVTKTVPSFDLFVISITQILASSRSFENIFYFKTERLFT
jgi:hypothetical protein